MDLKVGDVMSWRRTFAEEDILRFADLTGDRGRHHLDPDEGGRRMAHGLLTASLATKIGGDLDYIARQMVMEFLRPVFAGDTITCDVTVTHVAQQDGYRDVALRSVYRNQHGKEVLVGTSHGIIRDTFR